MFYVPCLPAAALGIVALFGYGIASYGLFHMMDYPIFLGLAVRLALAGIPGGWQRLLRMDPARVGAAVTLMWASIEKWAYPGWSYPVLDTHPALTLGLAPSFCMTAAGVVEFSLAFGLLWTPLVRRLSALVLAAMFVGAVFEFGKIDAIGHLLIVAILLTIAADDARDTACAPALAPAAKLAGLATTLGAYYGVHAVIFGT
jgi:hypothetical protein